MIAAVLIWSTLYITLIRPTRFVFLIAHQLGMSGLACRSSWTYCRRNFIFDRSILNLTNRSRRKPISLLRYLGPALKMLHNCKAIRTTRITKWHEFEFHFKTVFPRQFQWFGYLEFWLNLISIIITPVIIHPNK